MLKGCLKTVSKHEIGKLAQKDEKIFANLHTAQPPLSSQHLRVVHHPLVGPFRPCPPGASAQGRLLATAGARWPRVLVLGTSVGVTPRHAAAAAQTRGLSWSRVEANIILMIESFPLNPKYFNSDS